MILSWLSCISIAVTSLIEPVHAYAGSPDTSALPEPWNVQNSTLQGRQSSRQPQWLRILPLGASIVHGLGSSPQDGFRKPLRDYLRANGWNVNMVGSLNNNNENPPSSMANDQHEGHSGHIIDQVYDNLEFSIDRKPNIVLINAGTNDCARNIDIKNAHVRLGRVLDKIFQRSPRATIILSTLLPNANDGAANDRVKRVNTNIRKLFANRRNAGQRIVLAEMNYSYNSGTQQWIGPSDLNSDGIHPTNDGYRKMASVWAQAIQRAADGGMLLDPEDTGVSDTAVGPTSCKKVAGDGKGPVQVQKGSGDGDGAYTHRSTYMGSMFNISAPVLDSDAIQLAQVINVYGNTDRGGALDDLILYYIDKVKNQAVLQMWPNVQNGKFGNAVFMNVNDPSICGSYGVRWGDVNNDGLDDYICIDAQSNMYVSLNKGAVNGVPQFQYIGLYFAAQSGYSQRHVRLGDIDGDGRLDYCVTLESDGNIRCWRNGGQGDKADYWQDLGTVFTGKGKGDIRGTRFVDINGDFRSDWVWVDETGKTDIYTNARRIDVGMAPAWTQATAAHGGVGATSRNYTKFGRVYGENHVAYGGFRADYIQIYWSVASTKPAITYNAELRAWRNEGDGGTKLRADGNRYCDMTGNGRDDYIWIRSTGEMTMYRNVNGPPYWGQDGEIFNVNRNRKSVHLADWTGDGKCDILAVERTTGRVEMWENTYGGSGKVTFAYRGWLDSRLNCDQGWGVGVFDLGLRFADITGDGKADYLCMDPTGRTTGFVNEWPNGVRDVGQIRYSVGKDRANHRWADVNGDGRADYLWVDKFDGSTSVWYNDGEQPESERANLKGSKFRFVEQGKLYNGLSIGANQYYPDLDGNNKADILWVDPVANTANVYYNKCDNEGDGGGDDANTNPNLAMPPSAGNVWDYSPRDLVDTSVSNPQPPYPTLKNPDGSNITIENLRGTRIFSFLGCGGQDSDKTKIILQAYADFIKLATNKALYDNLDWNSDAAKEFFGPSTGDYRLRDDTRKEIKQIFQAAEQVRTYSWDLIYIQPIEFWKYLWIEVRCSDGRRNGQNGIPSSDPTDFCGDAGDPNGRCPSQGPGSGVFAFSDNQFQYSRITFCNKFFNDLKDLNDVVSRQRSASSSIQNDLNKWDNRARVFFHEVTHLDYFMNAPDDSPYVSDLEIYTTHAGEKRWHGAYGPTLTKLLTRYQDRATDDPNTDGRTLSGFYTQRNSDNYAYFALAKYVESIIGRYPYIPRLASNRKPPQQPRNAATGQPLDDAPPAFTQTESPDSGDGVGDQNPQSLPQCGDKAS